MRRARAAALSIGRPDLVECYLAHRAARGMNTDHKVRLGARALLAAVPDLTDFCRLPLERQLAFNHETHRFISWLAVMGRMQPGADYLVARRPRLGIVLARTEPELHLRALTPDVEHVYAAWARVVLIASRSRRRSEIADQGGSADVGCCIGSASGRRRVAPRARSTSLYGP